MRCSGFEHAHRCHLHHGPDRSTAGCHLSRTLVEPDLIIAWMGDCVDLRSRPWSTTRPTGRARRTPHQNRRRPADQPEPKSQRIAGGLIVVSFVMALVGHGRTGVGVERVLQDRQHRPEQGQHGAGAVLPDSADSVPAGGRRLVLVLHQRAQPAQDRGHVRSSEGHGSSTTWYRLDNDACVNSVHMNSTPPGIPGC